MAMTLFKPTMHFQFDKKQTMRLKGILAILIVMYHTKMNVVGGFIDTYWGYVIVSMFMFVTGYGLMASYTIKGEVYLQTYFRHRFLKLFPPLALATTLFMIIESFAGHGSFINWYRYFKQTGIPPIGPTWYIYCIIFFYLFFYISMKIGKNKIKKIAILIILSLLFSTFIRNVAKWDDFWWCSTFAFLVGVMYEICEKQLFQKLSNTNYLRIYSAILLGVLSGLAYLYYVYSNLQSLYLFINILPMTLVVIIYNWGIPEGRIFTFLGSISYEIFIVHDIFITFLYTFTIPNGIIKFCIVIGLSIPSAYALNKFCSYLLKKI